MAKEIPEEDGGVEEEVVNNGNQDSNVPAYEEPTKDTSIPSAPVFRFVSVSCCSFVYKFLG